MNQTVIEGYLELGKTCELTIIYMMNLTAFSQIDGRCLQEMKAMSREMVLAQKPCHSQMWIPDRKKGKKGRMV
jgi:hypothetical protein